jgi:hypothetical protein
VANADTHQWCSDLETDRAASASSRTVRHGHPYLRLPEVATGPCRTPNSAKGTS